MDNYFRGCPANVGNRNLSDYKTTTRREEYIKYINGIVRDDEYRLFLQQNGKEFMDREFNWYKQTQSCYVNNCVHNYPTRQSPLDLATEKRLYDSRLQSNIKNNGCTFYKDYKLSD